MVNPFKKSQPGCSCCETVLGCTPCFNSDPPDQFQVVISGVTIQNCTTAACHNWNGTWILSATTTMCLWRYDLTAAEYAGMQTRPTFCLSCNSVDSARLELLITALSTAGNIVNLRAYAGSSTGVGVCGSSGFMFAQSGSTTSYFCRNLVNHDIGSWDFSADGSHCISAATNHVLITSLAT